MTKRLLVVLVVLVVLVAAGCSDDPSTSDAYQNLEAELMAAEQRLADTETRLREVTAARDALSAEVATTEAGGFSDGELPDEAVAVMDGYSAALLDADGQAMLDYVTDDFTFLSYGTDVQEREFRADYVTRYYGGFNVESIGEWMVLGGGDTFIVAIPERATTPAVAEGFSTMRLVRVDGDWLVDAHRFTGE
jgi:hypothetical protein